MDKENKKKKGYFILFLNILILIFLLTAGMTSNVCTLLCAIFISIMFFFQTPNEITSELFLFYPFYNLFKFGGVGISYYNIILAAAVLSMILKKINRGTIKKIGLIILFCLYMIIVNLIQQNTLEVMTILGDYLIPFCLVILVFSNKNEISFKNVVIYYSIGLVISSLCGLGIIPLKNLNYYISPVHYRFGGIRLMRLQGLVGNPNYFSLDLNMAISCILISLFDLNKKIYKIILILILIIFGVATLSKSFILALLISIIFILFFNIKKINASTIFFIIIPILFLCVFFATKSNYFSLLINRLAEGGGDIDSFTSSRSTIWFAYIEYIFSNLDVFFIGAGISSNYLIVNSTMHAMHNTYIEIIYYLGIFGFIFLFFMIKNSGMIPKERIAKKNYLPLIILCVRLFAINIFAREAFCICIILVGLAINSSKGQEKGDKNILYNN